MQFRGRNTEYVLADVTRATKDITIIDAEDIPSFEDVDAEDISSFFVMANILWALLNPMPTMRLIEYLTSRIAMLFSGLSLSFSCPF